MALKNILIIGSTGNLGKWITQGFISSKEKFDSVAVLTNKDSYATKKDKFEEFEKQGIKVVTVADVSDVTELAGAFKGYDVVISAVGVALLGSQKKFVDAAIEAGVKRFYPSEFGGNANHGDAAKIEINQPKIEVQKYIIDKAAQNPSFEYTFFATSLFSDYLGGFGAPLVGADLQNHTIKYIGDGSTRFSTTPLQDIGNYVVASVLNPASSRNKTVEVQSQDISFAELKSLYEKIQGVKYTVLQTSIEELQKEYEAAKASGNMMGTVMGSLRLLFYKGTSLNQTHDETLYPEVKPHTVEETIRPMLS